MTLFHSCNLDQVEVNYSDFESAKKDDFFEKGWVPSELVFKSMTDIYQRANLDLNSCIFSFKVSKTDINLIKQKSYPSSTKFKHPKGIKLPSDWAVAVDKLDHYLYTTVDKNDSVYLTIDNQVGKIYGWRN